MRKTRSTYSKLFWLFIDEECFYLTLFTGSHGRDEVRLPKSDYDFRYVTDLITQNRIRHEKLMEETKYE